MNKIIILKNNDGRLANKLWNFASVYSYCLERGYDCENYDFFRYAHYFNFKISSKFVYYLFFKSYLKYKNIKLFKFLYGLYTAVFVILFKKFIVNDGGQEFNLPPSLNINLDQIKKINYLDLVNNQTFYFCGWLFRNKVGLEKYYNNIKVAFAPKVEFIATAVDLIDALRKQYKLIVGVHIRQGDYKIWHDGLFFYTCKEVRIILDNFLKSQTNIPLDSIMFVICSDGNIDDEDFSGLNYCKGPGTEISDLYLLSLTNIIIGSNSTYGAWASYYGNIPLVIFSRDEIKWPNFNSELL